jgi:hypothetical protein
VDPTHRRLDCESIVAGLSVMGGEGVKAGYEAGHSAGTSGRPAREGSPMARVTRRDVSLAPKSTAPADRKRTPSPRPTTTSSPSKSAAQVSTPPAPLEAQTSGPAPRIEREKRERYEWHRTALEWQRFETWCASNGLRSSPATPEAVALIAVYITYMAATGRNVATVARALLRDRERKE